MLNVTQVGQGPSLVLLHGWGTSSAIWQPLLKTWQAHFQITCVDLPGMGQSPYSSYQKDQLCEALLSVTPADAIWLGWSLGGLIALMVSSYAKQHVKGLVMTASNPCFVEKADWPGISTQVLDNFNEQLITDPQALLSRFIHTHLMDLAASLRRQILQALEASPKPQQQALTAGLHWLHQDWRAELRQLDCMNLHIYGKLDRLVPVTTAEAVQAMSPHAYSHILKKSAHVPFYSQADEFLQLLLEFAHDCTYYTTV